LQTFLKNKNLKVVLFFSLLIIPFLIFIPDNNNNNNFLATIENRETDLKTSLSKEYTTEIETIGDSSIDESFPEWNNGSSSEILVSGYSERDGTIYGEDWCYFKFPINSSLGNYKSAKIKFSIPIAYEDAILAIHSTSNSWTEDTLTWNNRPSKGKLINTFFVNESNFHQYQTVDISTAIGDNTEQLSLIVSYYDKTNTTGSGLKIRAKEYLIHSLWDVF